MDAHRTDTTVSGDGSVTVSGLPFRPGDEVEVIVRPRAPRPEAAPDAPLRGSVRRYDDPFGPAAPLTDWSASDGGASTATLPTR